MIFTRLPVTLFASRQDSKPGVVRVIVCGVIPCLLVACQSNGIWNIAIVELSSDSIRKVVACYLPSKSMLTFGRELWGWSDRRQIDSGEQLRSGASGIDVKGSTFI